MAAPRVTIDELPEQTSAVGTDLLVVQNGTVTKKLLIDKLTTASNAALTAHVTDFSAAHVASAIGATPNAFPLSGTDVQTQLAQTAAALEALGGGTTLSAEDVRDIVAAFVQAGANVTVVHDDPGNILTISSTGGGGGGGGITTEDAVDAVAAAMVAGTGINVTYNDAANTITVAYTGGGGVTDGDKGAIIVGSGGTVWTLDDDVVTNAKIADSPPLTIKGNNTGSVTQIKDLTVAQTKTMLAIDNVTNTSDANKPVSTAQAAADALKADKTTTVTTTAPVTGSGTLGANLTIGVTDFTVSARGTVPTPGGTSSGRYLKDDGTWALPSAGASSIGGVFPFTYNTSTVESITGNQLRGNNSTFANSTKLWVSETTVDGLDVAVGLSRIKPGFQVYIQDYTSSARYAIFNVTADPIDKGTYWELSVVTSSSLGTIPGGKIALQSLSSAQASSLFSTTTTAPGLTPGSNSVGTTMFLRADGSWAAPPGGGGGIAGVIVQEGDVTVAAAAQTIDFGTGFDVTESPANEANVALDLTEYTGGALPVAGGGTGATSAGAALTALGAQPLDADLTTIAGLTATTNNIIQSTGSAWASRTPTQVTATLDVATSVLKGLLPAYPGNTTTFLRGDGTYATPGGGAAASETVAGIAEIATSAEVTTGGDDTRIVTPLKLAAVSATKVTNVQGVAGIWTGNQAAYDGIISKASNVLYVIV